MTRSSELDSWLDEWSQHIADWEAETGKIFLGENSLMIKPPRGRFECWLDQHNHKMELLRTLTSAIAAVAGVAVFLKVFGVI